MKNDVGVNVAERGSEKRVRVSTEPKFSSVSIVRRNGSPNFLATCARAKRRSFVSVTRRCSNFEIRDSLIFDEPRRIVESNGDRAIIGEKYMPPAVQLTPVKCTLGPSNVVEVSGTPPRERIEITRITRRMIGDSRMIEK